MPKFHNLHDAQRIILAAWESFKDKGSVESSIGNEEVLITWRHIGGRMDASTSTMWEFTGDQGALADWWTSFGEKYEVLPAEWKGPDRGFQINLQYTAARETWFNYHLTVPDPDGGQ